MLAVLERIGRLHAAQILQDEEMFTVEDTISDFIEIKGRVGAITLTVLQANPVAAQMRDIIALSSGMPNDEGFVRQMRRRRRRRSKA